MTPQVRPTQRPNGRSARIRVQVHRAVLDLMAECGLDELTISLVAERSGVHPATIYRRWSDVRILLEDVVAAGPARSSPLPDTGSLRGDLEACAGAVAETLSPSPTSITWPPRWTAIPLRRPRRQRTRRLGPKD